MGSLIIKVSDAAFSFLVTVTLARTLGPSGYGSYSYVFAIIMLLAIPAQFGLPSLLVRETAKALARQEWGRMQGVWRWAGKFTGILTVVLVLGTGIAVLFFGKNFSQEKLHIMLWGLALVPLLALGELRGAALRGLHRVIEGQIPEQALFPILFFLFIAGGVYLFPVGITPVSAMALQVAAAALAFITGAWLLWRATPTEVHHAAPTYESRQWLMSALPLAFIGGMQLINNRTSILILGMFTDSAQVGIFRVADQMALLITIGLQTINLVVAPQFARLHAMGDIKRLQKLVTVSARISFLMTALLGLIFLLFGRGILHIIFGMEFVPAYYPLITMAAGLLISSAAGSVGILMNMTGYEKDTATAMMVGAIGNIILCFILIPVWGMVGAALAETIALSAWNILLVLMVRKRLNINSLAFGSVK